MAVRKSLLVHIGDFLVQIYLQKFAQINKHFGTCSYKKIIAILWYGLAVIWTGSNFLPATSFELKPNWKTLTLNWGVDPLHNMELYFREGGFQWTEFSSTCQEFCSQGRGCLPQCMLGYTPLGRHPQADTPWANTLQADTLPGQTPPPQQTATAADWSAFLSIHVSGEIYKFKIVTRSWVKVSLLFFE